MSRQITPSGGTAGGFLPIKSTEVAITNLTFDLIGYCSASGFTGTSPAVACTADKYQPKVTILLGGVTQDLLEKTPLPLLMVH